MIKTYQELTEAEQKQWDEAESKMLGYLETIESLTGADLYESVKGYIPELVSMAKEDEEEEE